MEVSGFVWYVFVYSCSHLSLSGCVVGSIFFCIHPKHTHTRAMSALHAQTQIGAFLYKESKPGASNFEIKSMSLCSTSAPGMRGRTWKCRSEERGTAHECCDVHSRGITPSLLSIPLNQETSGRKGRRIRLAGEQPERKSGFSLILMGFSEVRPSLWRCVRRAVESRDRTGSRCGTVFLAKPFTLAWKRFQQTRGISRSVITPAELQEKQNVCWLEHTSSGRAKKGAALYVCCVASVSSGNSSAEREALCGGKTKQQQQSYRLFLGLTD